MAKISRQTREIINIVLFFVVVGLLLTFYVIYPLNRTKALMGRADIDDFNYDSLPPNDPALFVEAGLTADTFRTEIDITTTLAGLYIEPAADSLNPETRKTPKGTVFLVPDERLDRNSMIPLTKMFSDSGFAVVTYDQRASGLSSGKYHGEGFYEANDLEELIPYLELRGRINHPLTVIGYSLGADAALLAAAEEKRIDKVVAVNPYLTTIRYQNMTKEEHGTLWMPFFRTIMRWWFNMRSGYAAPYREIDDIQPAACPTLMLVDGDRMDAPENARIKELSGDSFVLKQRPDDDSVLFNDIITFIGQP